MKKLHCRNILICQTSLKLSPFKEQVRFWGNREHTRMVLLLVKIPLIMVRKKYKMSKKTTTAQGKSRVQTQA